jgi:hypothetical protein
MSALLITVGRFRKGGDEALRHYLAAVVPLIAGAGGEVVSRGRAQETSWVTPTPVPIWLR